MKTRLFFAAAVFAGLIALATACGGSGGAKATPSPDPTAAPQATATPAANLLVVPSPTRTILETVFDAPPPSGISTLTFIDPLHGWAIDSCPEHKSNQFVNTWCTIMSTDNGGVTWQRQYRDIGKLGELQFLDAMDGFAIGGAGILATIDGGTTWSPLHANAPPDLSWIRFITAKIGFALASGIIFQLNDAGNVGSSTMGVLTAASHRLVRRRRVTFGPAGVDPTDRAYSRRWIAEQRGASPSVGLRAHPSKRR